ncbi:MAG: TylF/MycF/NovP-related O-methyltransferase [Bryobacteraceae bacterium]
MRPATFVELGTQYGESYFGFCQAIRDQGVRCSAFAVDTWRGDAQTGAYGEEVFEDVERHNRTYYESFSRLLRMTFDDAAPLFDPETIDLLHIDGLHTYDALRRDFEIWFPKVRAGGIVLLHDIEVRQGDFGVWRVWEELQKQYRTFSFSHSCGLGVIAKPGPAEYSGVLALLFDQRPGAAEAVRQHYELCADRLELRHARNSTERADINPQLFWRCAGEEFSEDRSVRRYVSIGPDMSSVRVTAPPPAAVPVQLRIDIADRPIILEVTQATIEDSAGEAIWDLVSSRPLPELGAAGLRITPLRSGRSVLLNVFEADNWLLPPLDEERLARLKDGYALVLQMRRLSPQGCSDAAAPAITPQDSDVQRREAPLQPAQELAAGQAEQLEAARRSLVDRDRENVALRAALAAMTSSLTWRLTRPVRSMVTLLLRSSRAEKRRDSVPDCAHLYLDLMKNCLTRMLFPDCSVDVKFQPTGLFDPEARRNGQDWPSEADTMIGIERLASLETCLIDAILDKIPGDFVETGVWRGGACILMKAVLKALAQDDRRVWVVDSFEGLPKPNPGEYPADSQDRLWESNAYLGVSLDRVRANFEKYGLLDDRVRFLKGWFKDTLPSAPIDRIAVLRLDGDMYESTMNVLDNLYERVSRGGYVVVDDYGALANCRAAVDAFRARHGSTEEIHWIDWTGIYWRRS